mmetsp:Transcript_24603/g.31983  ORF Transcript_24603/g.31983 Transcript_24603/m.31983 type:complete len:313 (+) Transcript_24603:286-1224(+)|eukprot:CAMPEP_0117778868 /NCGR_PEP_ID=MMETSP0948-20121206/1253_1 /TAXON_ID=44440 /ORGANISM="Chattonella subsalsa, Strain CCMP2191" /LENGTH=312 /DNA_ID=CAMNT_0005606283 /DNA_START=424 /DNA_END=1362 /DNA_ORIENTATION=+
MGPAEDVCRSCKSDDIVTDYGMGDIVCRSCGIIQGERILDASQEWRTFSNGDLQNDKSRCIGTSRIDELLQSNNLATIIAGGCEQQQKDLSRTQARAKFSSRDKTILAAVERINGLGAAMGVHDAVLDCAHLLYRKAKDDGVLNNRNPNVVCATLLYIACRQEGQPRSFKEVSEISGISKKQIGKCFLHIQKKMELQVERVRAEDWVRRIGGLLQLRHKVVEAVIEVEKKAQELSILHGQNPIDFLGAAVYMVSSLSDEARSLEEISKISAISEKKLVIAYKKLHVAAADILPKDFLLDGSRQVSIEDLPSA